MESILKVILSLTVLSVIMITTVRGKVTPKSMDRTCYSATCNETAEYILNAMNEDVLPCNNFYDFSCGGFMRRVIPANESEISPSIDMKNRIKDQIKRSLTNSNSKGPAIAKKLMKKFMDSCVSENHTRHRGQRYLRSDLKKLGGFPVLESNWTENNFDLTYVIGNITNIGFGIDALLHITYWRDGLKTHLMIDDPALAIDRHNLINHFKYGNDSHVNAYFNLMMETLKKLDADTQTAECDMREVLKLSMSLAQITMSPVEKAVVSRNPKKMFVSELYRYQDQIDWVTLLRTVFGPDLVPANSRIAVAATKLLRGLSKLFKKYSKRTWANYLLWSVTFDALPYMDESFIKLSDKFNTVIDGRKQRKSVERICQNQMTGRLNIALSMVYVADNVPHDIAKKVKPMIENIKTVFVNLLKNLPWMDAQTKQRALTKFRTIEYVIGYPQEVVNDTIINSYLTPIHLTDSVYENKKQLLVSAFKEHAEALKLPTSRLNWKLYAALIPDEMPNLYLVENVIVLPSGMLQKGFFSPDQPEYRNYGVTGRGLAYMLVHTFDHFGKNFDGNANNVDWWSNVTLTKYNKMKKCMIDQYNNYSFSGHKVNGEQTLEDNLPLNIAINQVYSTYLKVMDADKELPKLKKYTKKQLFWISFAQSMCAKYTAQEIKRYKKKSIPVAKYRVIGAVSNQPKFKDDFNCPASSPMTRGGNCKFL